MAHALTVPNLGLEGMLERLERPAAKARAAGRAAKNGTAVGSARGVRAAGKARNPDDPVLVQALLDGERGAWNRFVQQYAGIVYAAAQRRLLPAGRGDEVEDVAQDVFVRLCKADHRLLRNFDPARARLSTWLTVVATSAAIDHLRRQRLPNLGVDDVPESCLAVEDPVFENVKIPEGLLSERQALVLELLYRRDLEVADAAQIMQVDPQTVRSTHHKALTKLRAHFKEIGEI